MLSSSEQQRRLERIINAVDSFYDLGRILRALPFENAQTSIVNGLSSMQPSEISRVYFRFGSLTEILPFDLLTSVLDFLPQPASFKRVSKEFNNVGNVIHNKRRANIERQFNQDVDQLFRTTEDHGSTHCFYVSSSQRSNSIISRLLNARAMASIEECLQCLPCAMCHPTAVSPVCKTHDRMMIYLDKGTHPLHIGQYERHDCIEHLCISLIGLTDNVVLDRDPELPCDLEEDEYDFDLNRDDWYFEKVSFIKTEPFSISVDSGSVWMKDCRYYGGIAFAAEASFNALNCTFRNIPMLLRSMEEGASDIVMIEATCLRRTFRRFRQAVDRD